MPATNSEVIYRLLGRFPLSLCTLSLSLTETSVFFTDYPEPFELKGKELKGKKLKRRLLEEAEKERTVESAIPLSERHEYLQTDQGNLLSIVHEDPLESLNLLDELKPFVGRIQISFIEPVELTLINLVRRSYPPEQLATAIVFVGEGFSRVSFMRDGHYLSFSQPIHEGIHSPQILRTMSSRILFEQDMSGLGEIGRVLLAGNCRTLDAQPFFAEPFPDATVEHLALPDLGVGELEESERELTSSFAVPIGLAWKALEPKASAFYPTNFLPKARRKMQNPFELGWHGLVLIALLATSLFMIGLRAQEKDRTIDSLRLSIDLKQRQVQENNPYVIMVDELQAQIVDYETNFALIDTLAGEQISWSAQLQGLASAVQKTGGLWLERFATSEGDLDIAMEWGRQDVGPAGEVFMFGKTSRRSRVPDLAELVGDGQIPSIVRSKIRGRTVYEFEMITPVSTNRTTRSAERAAAAEQP